MLCISNEWNIYLLITNIYVLLLLYCFVSMIICLPLKISPADSPIRCVGPLVLNQYLSDHFHTLQISLQLLSNFARYFLISRLALALSRAFSSWLRFARYFIIWSLALALALSRAFFSWLRFAWCFLWYSAAAALFSAWIWSGDLCEFLLFLPMVFCSIQYMQMCGWVLVWTISVLCKLSLSSVLGRGGLHVKVRRQRQSRALGRVSKSESDSGLPSMMCPCLGCGRSRSWAFDLGTFVQLAPLLWLYPCAPHLCEFSQCALALSSVVSDKP